MVKALMVPLTGIVTIVIVSQVTSFAIHLSFVMNEAMTVSLL